MESSNPEFSLPSSIPPEAILARIAQHWRLAEEPAQVKRRIYYDTFDWSLYADGGRLEHREDGEVGELIWTPDDPDQPSLHQSTAEVPGFAWQLPAGPVRARIQKASGIRRLLPMMELESRTRTLRLLDDEDKTRVRLLVEEYRVRDPSSGRHAKLAPRVLVRALRGYDTERTATLDLLANELGLEPAPASLLQEALSMLGRRPGDYSSKIDLRLEPEARADRVTKTILLSLLDTLERNIEGTRANLDSEFLHDLRVAVRRTRSALSQIRSVLPPAVVARYKERFAWLQQVTGPVRDLDVYLLDFDTYQQALPTPMRPHLEPLRSFILAHYDEEQERLAAALGSTEFTALLAQWRRFLTSPIADDWSDPAATDGPEPIKSVADRRIWRMLKRVRREGRAIGANSPATEMHELRKSCKKLRYLMEFFQSLYPEDAIRGPIRLLKVLLDNLGDFQDLAVQAVHLRDLALRMDTQGGTDPDTLLAMGALIGHLYERQQKARESFTQVFADFMDQDNQERLRTLLVAPQDSQEAETGPQVSEAPSS